MPERTRREIDNQMGNISEYSEEINDEQEVIDYTIDEYRSRPIYQKDYHTEGPYPFPEEYRRESRWRERPEHFQEYSGRYRGTYEERYPEGAWDKWGEERSEDPEAWPKKEKKQKKEDGSRKKSKFRVCTNCGTTTTPAWRRSTNNKILLCNACGLYQRLHGSDRPFSVTPDGKTKAVKNNVEKGVCKGCGVSQTPLWKRGSNNEWLCSSCGLLYNRRERPEEYVQEWPEYSQEESWKYGSEYPDYPEWHGKEREQGMQYQYDEKDSDGNYFSEERFRGYPGYYEEDKPR